MTDEQLIEKIARMIAEHVGAEKFWGLYRELAAHILKEVDDVSDIRHNDD